MKIVGLMLARNEEWVIGTSLRAALLWCDEVVVLDHASTDATPRIVTAVAKESGGRVHSLHRPDVGVWEEMAHRQATLDEGRRVGGTHFAIVDADEVLSANLIPVIRACYDDLMPGDLLELPMVPCWRSCFGHRVDDCVWTNCSWTHGFADDLLMGWRPVEGYHYHHRAPIGAGPAHRPLPIGTMENGGVLHLQFAPWDRLTAKHAWYKMMETVRYPGRRTAAELNHMYGKALNERGLRTKPCVASWWGGYPEDVIAPLLEPGGAPWQADECRRMMREHGAHAFDGLDLFGVV